MKVLICDDDIQFSNVLANDFKDYFFYKLNNVDIEIANCDFSSYKNSQADVCFMDIDLVGENGIHIVKEMKKHNKNLVVIFVSVREDLVFNTFSVEPFQFIRKNHYQSDLYEVFRQLNGKINRKYAKIMIRDNKRFIYLAVDEIITVIIFMHDLIINTSRGTYYSTGTLKHFYEKNKKTSLVQIQKNMIINIEKIKSISKNNIIYEDGKTYEIGRVYKDDFKAKYEEYIYDS